MPNTQISNPKRKRFDLEERCFLFAEKVVRYVNALPRTIPNIEISKQLIRSSGSVGANYIEANESLGKKDFLMRIKISKKEAKESRFWLLLTLPHDRERNEKIILISEATEIMNIMGSILNKSRKVWSL